MEKKIILISILIIGVISSEVSAQHQSSSNLSKADFAKRIFKNYNYKNAVRRKSGIVRDQNKLVLYILHKYSKSGFNLMEKAYSNPSDVTQWLYGKKIGDLLYTLPVVVHENCHSLQGGWAYSVYFNSKYKKDIVFGKDKFESLYVNDDKLFLILQTKSFPSDRIAKTIPESIKGYRYSNFNNYIKQLSIPLSTQTHGIYGLINELCAYYHGAKAAVDIVGFYETEMPQTPGTWYHYFKAAYWHMRPYGEFKYYIQKYLIYAKKNEPTVYECIMNNDSFKRAYIEIDKSWTSLENQFNNTKARIFNQLKSRGFSVTETDKAISIRKGRRRKGTYSHIGFIKKVKTELSKPAHIEMDRAIRKIPSKNYGGFRYKCTR